MAFLNSKMAFSCCAVGYVRCRAFPGPYSSCQPFRLRRLLEMRMGLVTYGFASTSVPRVVQCFSLFVNSSFSVFLLFLVSLFCSSDLFVSVFLAARSPRSRLTRNVLPSLQGQDTNVIDCSQGFVYCTRIVKLSNGTWCPLDLELWRNVSTQSST